MKQFKITYYLMPDSANVTITISAKSYEDACIFAKGYRKESFSCDEITEEKAMKQYAIRPEYLSLWGEDCTEDTVIDTAEVERLAAEWEMPIEELLEQLIEVDD